MSWFADLRLRSKLMVSFAAVIALTALLGVFAATRLSKVSEQAATAGEVWGRKAYLAGDMNAATGDLRIAELQMAMADGDRTRFEQKAKDRLDAISRAFDQYNVLVSDKDEQTLRDRFQTDWQAYKSEHDKLLSLAHANDKDGLKSWAEGPSKDEYDRYSAVLDEIVAFNAKGVQASSAEGKDISDSARWAILVMVLVVTGLALTFARIVSSEIANPMAEAVEVLKAMAEGDLTRRVRTGRKDEVGDVQAALSAMQQHLSSIVRDVRQGADSVATASSQIAQGNGDLSARTETQASSLQQTAASVEEMAGTVRTNAGNAQQANQLATAASDAAMKGGKVVGEVVNTMAGIQASSSKIADIIGVIDGIAFQTNILALNAAVEAARAGEQGRGFAVVAGEVRTLAQRSANAAREIKSLIHDSVEKVNAGSALVHTAGDTIQDVVTQVRRVTDLVGEIAHASSEQSQGITQINQAVSQLDQTTQQNAALVEQSMAAADSLKVQAGRLAEAMSVFRVDNDGLGGHGAGTRVGGTSTAAASARPAASFTPVTPVKPARAARVRTEPASAPLMRPQLPAPTTTAKASDVDWETF